MVILPLDDESFSHEQQRIERLYETYMPLLGFADWTTRLYYHRSSVGMPCKMSKKRQAAGNQIGMTADASWQYRQLGIHIDCSVTAEHDDATIEKLLIHEFMHGVVAEMCEDDPTHKHEERVVTWLSDIVIWVADHGRALGREEVMAQDTAAADETPHSVDSTDSSSV